MKIMRSCINIYIWWLPYVKDLACTSACAQTSLRLEILDPRKCNEVWFSDLNEQNI